MVEQAVTMIAQENMELGCAIIQKIAVEKSLNEIEKRLANDYEVRKQAKLEGTRYCDPKMLTYQMDRIPEPIRVKPAATGSMQLGVYEEFSRSIPGFLCPMPKAEIPVDNAKINLREEQQQTGINEIQPTINLPSNSLLPPPGSIDDTLNIYDKLIGRLDNLLQDVSVYPSPLSNQVVSSKSLAMGNIS